MPSLRRVVLITAASAVVALAPAPAAWAHHGPGFSAGARSVPGGEIVAPGHVVLTVRYEQTEFERLSVAAIAERARDAGSFESMERALLVSPSLAVGVTPWLELGAAIGHFRAVGAREKVVDLAAGESESFRFDPDGLTDLWLNAKFAPPGGAAGRFSLQCGLKAPTGRREVDVTPEGAGFGSAKSGAFFHALEASALPVGSGSWDGLLGVGYTRRLSARVALDAGGHFVLRTDADDVRLGNRLDAGAVVTYRLARAPRTARGVSLLAQAALQSVGANRVEGERDANSGGTTLFLSPGARLDIAPGATLWIAPQIPVVQDVNGEQIEARFRLVTEFALLF